MDGIFEIVALIMRQLFSIHGLIDGQVEPLVYCIMSHKTQLAYEELFFELVLFACNLGIHLRPITIVSDFEKASVAAAFSLFPDVNFTDCLFHLGQILWRRIQSSSLAKEYEKNEQFGLSMRMLLSLTIIDADDSSAYFKELLNTLDENGKKVARWFRTKYIGTAFWSIAEKKYKTTFSENSKPC